MTMPTQTEYDEMVATLRDATAEMHAAPDDTEGRVYKRHLALRGMEAVMHYLLADPRVRDGVLTTPLAYARAAIHDAGLGARPAPASGGIVDKTGRPDPRIRSGVHGLCGAPRDLRHGENASTPVVDS